MARRSALVLLVLALVVPGVSMPQMAMAQSPMPLDAYPRPQGDNGWGIHWSPTLFGQPTDMVDRLLTETKQMGCTWIKLLQGDAPKLEHEYLIDRLTDQGMMPVLRVFQPWNEPYQHLAELVRLGVPQGVHYYELYNEPNLAGEAGGWRSSEPISVARMVDLWIPAAEAVTAAGGLPSLPPLAPGGDYDDMRFLRQFLSELRQRGRLDLLYQAWLPLHNYFLNHPLDYPNDAVNRDSIPLSTDEIARRGLSSEEVDRINHFRAISHLPREQGGYYVGDTVHEDSNGFLKFEAYARIMQEEVGFVVPIITTEGGAIIGSAEDPRYPATTEDDLVSLTLAAYDYMQHRPDYYFAFMPWLLANRAGNSLSPNWEGAAWLKEDGSSLSVVAALQTHVSNRAGAPGTSFGPTASAIDESVRFAPVGPRSVDTATHTFAVPDVAAVAQPSSPAHSTYPLPLVPPSAQPPQVERELEVIVLRNSGAEAWVLPALGARVVRLTSTSGSEVLPLTDRFTFRQSGNGAYYLEGGVRWLYPSPSLSVVEATTWSVEDIGSDPEPYVLLSCTEPRSRTRLDLRLSLPSDGALTANLATTNLNGHARTVSFEASSSVPSIGITPGGATEVTLAPQATNEWTICLMLPDSTAQEAIASPTPWPTTSATSTSSHSGRPAALVTPVPARSEWPTSIMQGPQMPATPIAPTVPAPASPATGSSVRWDSRLDSLGARLERSPSTRWELTEARYEDERESGGNHNIFVTLLGGDTDSTPTDLPWVSWSDGRQTLELKPDGSGWSADFPMYGTLGAYTVGVGDSSDLVTGLGLPGKQHVNFRLTFQRRD